MTRSAKDILRQADFLAGFDDGILGELSAQAREIGVAAGEGIFSQGDEGTEMYFVVEGRVRVHRGETTLATLGRGDVFGEMALLDAESRSASVTAEADSLLLCLDRGSFFDSLLEHPRYFQPLIAGVLRRGRRMVEDVTLRSRQVHAFEKELEIGRRIQADFLPERIPGLDGWEIEACFEAAREVAGDFYDVYRIGGGRQLGVVIGDVCDKGVGAALFMTLFRSLLRSTCLEEARQLAEDRDGYCDADEVLQRSVQSTNRYIATTHRKSSMFASVFFGILDTHSGRLRYINAGHEEPMLFRGDGRFETLAPTGGVLGLFPGAKFIVGGTVVERGDLLYAYTDGVNEAKDSDDRQFGESGILAAGLGSDTPAAIAVARVLEAVAAFRGQAAQSDDITMIALRRQTE